MDLADILTAAIRERSRLINSTGERWPDRPITIEMSWMPQMGKVDLQLRTIDHLPPWRMNQSPKLRAVAGSDSASE